MKLVLERKDLEDLPDYPLTEGYEITSGTANMAAEWLRIQERCDFLNTFDEGTFGQMYGHESVAEQQRRILFLAHEGKNIGSSSAWIGSEPYDATWGRVHWVAILPEFQGRGLSRPLMSATMQRLKELGHRGAYLTTDSRRPIAIRLYEQFGFVEVRRGKTHFGD